MMSNKRLKLTPPRRPSSSRQLAEAVALCKHTPPSWRRSLACDVIASDTTPSWGTREDIQATSVTRLKQPDDVFTLDAAHYFFDEQVEEQNSQFLGLGVKLSRLEGGVGAEGRRRVCKVLVVLCGTGLQGG